MISSQQIKSLWETPRRAILTLLSILAAHHSLSNSVINNDAHAKITVDAFGCNPNVILPRSISSFPPLLTRQSARSHQSFTKLHGVQEWRAKYSNHNTTSSSSSQSHDHQQDQQLPLLLLPFNPSQILLPGQTTSYTFRHGKYIDLIDDSITNYESVIGMSILSDDGLLPITVLCEVMEEELEIHMGYRGFSSMEVKVRAVGRVRRCDVNSNNIGGSTTNSFGGEDLRTTALDDIHLGKVADWADDPLDEEQKVVASEYRENIMSILRLRQTMREEEEDTQRSRLKRQQKYYASAYDIITREKRSSSIDDDIDDDFTATSWGAFAAATAIDRPNVDGSVNIDALSTTDTVERLRLGLAMLLENQLPLWSNNEGVDERSTAAATSARGSGSGSTCTPFQDGIDTFQ